MQAKTQSAPARGRREQILICLSLLGLIIAVYWPVARFNFVNYDDPEYVSENPHVQTGLSVVNVAWAFRTTFFENWHPLTWLSYLLDYQIFGLKPGAFHLVNLFFHGMNTLLLFAILNRITGARWPSAFVAVIFGLHPLHVESVAWVAERKDVLSVFFGLLTIWAYVRYTERPKAKGGPYLAALLFFALSLMAKPMLVTLPFILLLLDFWPLGRMVNRSAIKDSLRLVLEKGPFFALTGVSCVVTYLAQHQAVATVAGLSMGKRLANAFVSYVRYVGKTFWPVDLAVFYPHPGQWPYWQVIGSVLVLGIITLLVFRVRRERPYLLVGWLWFLGTLVPVIGLVQVGWQSLADRYTYFPLIGLLIIIGWGAKDLAECYAIR